MGRVRSATAVLPALLPGACVVLLAFQAGGFYPTSWAAVAAVAAVALALRVATVERPFAGIGAWSGVAIASLALFAVWTLVSATWSDAPGRALIEFNRVLAYLLVLVLCASLAARERRTEWGVRGVAIAIAVVCAAALAARLRPDLISETGLAADRLDYPITYWNSLGMLAGVGMILGLHLSASEREPWWVRVPAAALPPIAACTLYFTLSRGGIAATVCGLVAYVVLGFSRATPGALLAIVPPTALAAMHAYDLQVLVSVDYAGAAGRAEGRDMVSFLALAVAAAVALRAAALLVDLLLRRVPPVTRLPLGVRIAVPLVVVAVLAGAAVASGAPEWARGQVDTFLSPARPDTGPDVRDRLLAFNNNGRVDHWNVALDAFRAERLHGTGAGTFQNAWNRDRPEPPAQVLDAHSLYLEQLGELGVIGAGLLGIALLALMAGLAWGLRGPGRPAAAGVLAAMLAWAIHAGVDWDWELAAVTIWVFGLAGLALARPAAVDGVRPGPPRLLRLVVGLACLILALSPAALWRSQERLQVAFTAFEGGDCAGTIDAALDSLGAIGARAEPWELIAYCDVRSGQERLAVGAAEAAVARDPDNWEYHYALALVRAVAGEDPRAEAALALRLNPLQEEARDAVRAFRTGGPRAWERRARGLPLYRP